MKKVLVGLAVLGGLGLVALVLAAVVFRVWGDPAERFLAAFRPAPSGNPYPESSPLHAPYQRFVERLAAVPEFQQHLKTARDKDEAFSAGFLLARSGMRKLNDASLERRAAIVVGALDRMTEADCGRIVRGDTSNLRQAAESFSKALEQLDAASINDWLDLSFEATVAQLRNAPETPVSKQAVADAMRSLQEALPEPEARRLARTLGGPAAAPDPDMCWAGKTVFRTALTLPPAERSVLVRAFVQD